MIWTLLYVANQQPVDHIFEKMKLFHLKKDTFYNMLILALNDNKYLHQYQVEVLLQTLFSRIVRRCQILVMEKILQEIQFVSYFPRNFHHFRKLCLYHRTDKMVFLKITVNFMITIPFFKLISLKILQVPRNFSIWKEYLSPSIILISFSKKILLLQ